MLGCVVDLSFRYNAIDEMKTASKLLCSLILRGKKIFDVRLTSSPSFSSATFPRAAVAVTLQSVQTFDEKLHSQQGEKVYLLVQRANPPDAGKWSLPGGKIELGETTLNAGQRELMEETTIAATDCDWHPHPFMTTDAIFPNSNGDFSFHYVIAHCFARVKTNHSELKHPPEVVASDDALDAKWWTIDEIKKALLPSNAISSGVIEVLERANSLNEKNELLDKQSSNEW